MYKVHLQTESEDKVAAAIEALKDLRVEMVTSEDDPFVDALFYMARINSKLDNLGQLRHLFKLDQRITDVERALKPLTQYFTMLNEEKMFERGKRVQYYKKLVESYGFSLGVNYILMTEDEIFAAFRDEAYKREAKE